MLFILVKKIQTLLHLSPVETATTIFYLGSLLVVNNKVFFVWSCLYILVLFYYCRSYWLVLLYAYIPFSSIRIGQLYTFEIIPAYILNHPLYPEGQRVFFTFSPYIVLLFSGMAGLILNSIYRRGKMGLNMVIVFYLGAGVFQLISAMNSEFKPFYSVLLAITSIAGIAWIIVVRSELGLLSPKVFRKVITTFFTIIILSLVFESLITIVQYIKRSTIGIHIEQTEIIPYFGGGADENPLQFRPVGLTSHANILGEKTASLLWGIFLLSSYLIRESKGMKRKKIIYATILVGFCSLIVIILSQSRSVYLGVLAAIVVFAVLQRNILNRVIQYGLQIMRNYPLLTIMITIFSTLLIADRFWYSLYSFGNSGGFTTRALLVNEAWMLFQRFPLFGVGPGMFIQAAFEQNPLGVMKYFPESVHNGLLLLLVENGTLAAIMYFLAVATLVWKIMSVGIYKANTAIIAGSIIMSVVIMWFQPFILTLPFSIVIYLLLSSRKV